MWLRWFFTVCSAMSSRRAITLFGRPRARSSRISRSRGVRECSRCAADRGPGGRPPAACRSRARTVLRARHVADLGLDAVALQGRAVLVVQPVAGADEARLVGVGDAAIGRPELDAHDVITEHAGLHQPVQSPQRRRVSSHDGGRERRGDDALAGQARDLLGVADRLPAAGAADDRDRGEPDGDRRQQTSERELHDGRWPPGCDGAHVG